MGHEPEWFYGRSVIVDPPMGSAYGFPRAYDFEPSHPNLPGEEWEEERRQWFRDNGYPQSLIAQGMLDHCRYWENRA